MRFARSISVGIAYGLLGSACTGASEPASPSSETARATSSPSSIARERVAAGALLLDVRSPEEYAEGHIDGAVNIPVEQLAGRLDELPVDHGVVVYCRSGQRSARAASILRTSGRGVFDLGPMTAW